MTRKGRAIVLGARDDSGNIGEAIVNDLTFAGWSIEQHDCRVTNGTSITLKHGAKLKPIDVWGVPELDYEKADALVISLGKTNVRKIHESPPGSIEDIIDANLTLPLRCAAHYIQHRMERGGQILFIGSYAHNHPFTAGTAYCAAKAGINMAAKTLAWETTALGFRTYVVHPYHVVGTPMWEEVQQGVMRDRGWDRAQADDYAERDARMRLLRPSDVAQVVARILSDQSFEFLSGSAIEMYGGTR